MRSYYRSFSAGVGAVALATAMIACDNRILRVTTPDVTQPNTLQSAAALPTVTAAVYAQFGVAYAGDGGDHEGIIEDSGLLGDEFESSDTFPTRNQIDERLTLPDNGENELDLRYIQETRSLAESAVQGYQKFQPGVALQAEALSYVGYSYLLVAENWCSGIAFSTENADGSITYGPLESTNQMLHDARVRFDSALAILAADKAEAAGVVGPEVSFASVGKGRALVDSGDYADAATAVASVPDGFVHAQGYGDTPTRIQNGVFEYTFNEGRYTIADKKGTTGLPYISAADPRVPVVDAGGPGFDGATELFLQLVDTTRHSPIPVATAAEARLIEAEAELAAHGVDATFFAKINAARKDVNDTTTATAIPAGLDAVHFLFEERAFDLWLQAHRLGDMRRLIRQYGQAVSTVFPQGSTGKGVPYGNGVSLPLPIAELGNPHYAQCNTSIP